MKDLLEFILENLVGKSKFSIEETEENEQVNLKVKADPDVVGIIIGKEGNTINAIQTVLRVKSRLENKRVYVSVITD